MFGSSGREVAEVHRVLSQALPTFGPTLANLPTSLSTPSVVLRDCWPLTVREFFYIKSRRWFELAEPDEPSRFSTLNVPVRHDLPAGADPFAVAVLVASEWARLPMVLQHPDTTDLQHLMAMRQFTLTPDEAPLLRYRLHRVRTFIHSVARGEPSGITPMGQQFAAQIHNNLVQEARRALR